MNFFVPDAESSEQRDRVYAAIKDFLGKELGAVFSQRRLYSLRWSHNGIEYEARVGDVTAFNGELVIAILHEPARDLYHVCTPTRGVAGGGSILAGDKSVASVREFDA